jgi:3-phosphoshikimate 1-carboxyvinyltransferase
VIKKLDYTTYTKIEAEIRISGSKSESNRALILQKLFPNLTIENLSDSDDTKHLQKALESDSNILDIGHAGTAMRFLTAYWACKEGQTILLTGSERMQERPIKILVEALRQLGAKITYLNKEGYPPLEIQGKKITHSKVTLSAEVSSQYISALLLIAPSLENGLTLSLEGQITSLPYIQMTLALLNQLDVQTSFDQKTIRIDHLNSNTFPSKTIHIESDWSSASYFYGLLALAPIGSSLILSSYLPESLQGDSILKNLYQTFGVETQFNHHHIRLQKVADPMVNQTIQWDLNSAPDIAQTIAVTCAGLKMNCYLTGLHTLKIKETDRLTALQTELGKLGVSVQVTDDALKLQAPDQLKPNAVISTYNDHRMAMAFAPLALLVPIHIENPEVVSKSYLNFWKDLDLIFQPR